jgi:hypothetical protein
MITLTLFPSTLYLLLVDVIVLSLLLFREQSPCWKDNGTVEYPSSKMLGTKVSQISVFLDLVISV